jgi:hypothetical protein
MTRLVMRTIAHEVNRLEVAVEASYGDFRARYERVVPAFDAVRFAELQRTGAPWEAVLRATAESAPHGFLRYWNFDVTPLMSLAGDRWNCVEYLMGDHTTAQRMFTHDPAVMLYAPLRTAIYEDAESRTWLAVDQPSTRFASFGDAAIAAVGVELDDRLAALLELLAAPVPEVLHRRE